MSAPTPRRPPLPGFTPSGTPDHGLVNPARPFILNIARRIVDRYGRPVRGASLVYSYADEGSALADYRAAKAAKLRPLLRDFRDLDQVRVIGQ